MFLDEKNGDLEISFRVNETQIVVELPKRRERVMQSEHGAEIASGAV